MAKTGKFLSLHHLLANFLQLLFILEATKSSGLSIKLIHSHSLESPFYPGNITRSERIRLQVQTASAYAHRLSTAISSGIKTNDSNKTIGTNSIRPKMDNQELMYLVQTGIGTFAPPRSPYYKYLLHLDTASDLMWTQCEDCRKMGRGSCFRQAEPLFPASSSHTYRPLPCDRHALCYRGQCINGTCSYSLKYGDGALSLGYLAYESFTFDSDRNKTETVKDIVFGCGIKNKGFSESSKYNLVAGNFGLGPGKRSFLRQKQSLTLGRFSYCLPPWDTAHNFTVFLRFGADIPQREGLKVTPLMTSEGFVSYFVKLKGISVGNTRLDIPQKSFARSNNSYGGCIVDTGSSITLMPEPVYEKLKEMLIKNHFLRYKKTRKQGIMNLCYLFPRNTGLRDLPSITFHLQDADLVVPPEVGYIYGRTNFGKYYFCLGMSSGNVNGMTIIGALQQANMRFIFDTVKRKLYFGPEDCTLGA